MVCALLLSPPEGSVKQFAVTLSLSKVKGLKHVSLEKVRPAVGTAKMQSSSGSRTTGPTPKPHPIGIFVPFTPPLTDPVDELTVWGLVSPGQLRSHFVHGPSSYRQQNGSLRNNFRGICSPSSQPSGYSRIPWRACQNSDCCLPPASDLQVQVDLKISFLTSFHEILMWAQRTPLWEPPIWLLTWHQNCSATFLTGNAGNYMFFFLLVAFF